MVDQPFVKNEKANEGVMAFNFFKTVDEITESQALDTDLKTWAGAQGWKLSNEDESVDLGVDYDFEPENVKEGVYQITFSTTGREFKIHTTDYTEEGQEVGEILYRIGEFEVGRQKVEAAISVPERDLLWCLDQIIVRFFAGKNKISQ